MTQSLTSPTLAVIRPPARVNVPAVPSWVAPRPRVADRLDLGVSGLLTVVTAPTGAGKTMAAASWATRADLSGQVVWLSLAGVGTDPDFFWQLLRDSLLQAGVSDLPPVPTSECAEPRRFRMLADLAVALHVSGPWFVVLDDYPTGPSGRLERELEFVLNRAQRDVRLVVLSQGEPALALHRHAAAGELTRMVGSDLVMDTLEVADVLRRHDVDTAPATVGIVERRTAGWACGVRLGAVSLLTAPTTTAAMEQTEDAIVEFLSREVLAKLPSPVRDLIVRTSVADVVDPGLARAILGPDAEIGVNILAGHDGFIERRNDGSFRCHPLLRATARAQLSLEGADLSRDSRRIAARWYADQGDADAGIRLAIAAKDWAWVARALVESYAVPRVIFGAAGDVVESALRVPAVWEAEPVLLAAVALSHRHAPAAEVALERTTALLSGSVRGSLADRLSLSLARLTVARLRGDCAMGNGLAEEARHLLAQLPVAQQDDAGLSAMVAAHAGALQACGGDLDAAALTLARGARASTGSSSSLVARADCIGQLSLVEAMRGNLRRASHHAGSVLAKDPEAGAAGVMHAHLAMALVHLDRLELVPARQRLDRAARVYATDLEPWLVVAQELAEARLLTAEGQPEAALRLLAPALRVAETAGQCGWMVDLLAVASAEALLTTGEPHRVLEMISPRQAHKPVETGLLAASALRELGNAAEAREALAAVVADLASAPLRVQVECWTLEARFAQDDGRPERARLLVDRALRMATGEMLRRPFADPSTWLRAFVDRDVALRRAHSAFLAALSPAASPQVKARVQPGWSEEIIVETLTVREAQVLGLLAEMCSTDEIARELFLSVNTVKTYVRGILRKLCVNRRVDAVRRGRELGLC